MSAALIIIAAANALVGASIGICGIAGFLLPILYTEVLHYTVDQALAYSFLAFLVSGALGSISYHKAGNLDIPTSLKLGAGSLIGALAGVWLQALIAKSTAKEILYLVVLISGASILLRMYSDSKKTAVEGEASQTGKLVESTLFLLFLGATTGAICSLSGAGGPVLVMPLLVTFGISARLAVGIALFDSVFIAIPACIGYLARVELVWPLLALISCSHGIGVIIGSKIAGSVPVTALKLFVAVFSVCIAIYMLL